MIQGFDIKVLAKLQTIYDLITSSPPGATTWGSIVGTLSSQTDLQNALNAKFDDPTGTTSQYLRGDGSLATFPTIGTWGGLNYPAWSSGTPFVKMTAAGTFALDTNIYLSSISSSDVTTALGYTPVTNARTLSINGTSYDLSADRSWTISTGGGIIHGTASGTDTYAVTLSGVTSYADGDAYLIRFTTGNTTSATLNINSLGAVPLYRNNDGQLIGGDIIDGAEMLCIYNSSTNRFQVIGTAPNTLLAYVTNAETTTITKGQPVYAYGGTGDRLTVKLAYNTGDSTSAQTVGFVVSTSIAANQKGLIMVNGLLDGLSILKPSDGWADGDAVYLGATAGSVTKTKPVAPNHLVYLGFVTTASNGSAGRMYVRVQNGYELNELHDVLVGSYGTKDVLWRDTSTDLWKNKDIFTLMGAASGSTNGYLTSTDWTTFNSKGSGTVTSVAALTLGTSGTDLGSSVANGTTTPVITLNVPTASATNRGALSSTDWSTFNGKQNSITLTTTGTSGAATLVGSTLNIPQYTTGVGVYYKNSTTYNSSGSGSQILHSLLIPANTFVAGDVLRITARFNKTGTTNSSQTNILVNTSSSTSGATTIKSSVMVAAQLGNGVQGHAVIITNTTNTQYGWTSTTGGADFVGGAGSGAFQTSVATNWTANQYIIFSGNPTTDNLSLIFYMIEKL
jgi:hypothetical protein